MKEMLKALVIQMGVRSAFAAVDQAVRTAVAQKVRTHMPDVQRVNSEKK